MRLLRVAAALVLLAFGVANIDNPQPVSTFAVKTLQN